ncbi:PTS system ascorbate-specific IIC component [Diaminobutyricimonas aerilata]|uniref:Ascorbate-specific PTS system EIIC component n=1 Tax=Diaminobutyricimonas aerilata TaxID=1162967 RepID=A0A2M9CHZ0_9MICO|nr:PTS transporter subunit IIC [Diaminobutyricimonas aerilata]PJJ71534.1 PTS system ascorbate-specific IIC component [Diaminobutyricimonas aerilata]
MDAIEQIVRAITDNLFSQVSLLIGLIALLGLVLQRKPAEDVVAGTIRATVGVIVLTIGVDIFIGGLVAFQAIVSSALGLEPPTADSTLAEFSAGSGSVVPLIIAGGFVVHLVLVRIFRAARYVYLTGHLMYWMSVVLAASLVEAYGDVDRWLLAGVGSILIGCYWVLQPLWTAPLMRKVMGNDEVGLAHTDSTIAIASGYAARALRLGDPVRHDAEHLKLPRALSFFKDITVSTAFVTGIIMLIAVLFAAPDVVAEQIGDAAVAPWVWALLQALRFAGGIAIILFGVRMFLAEIVPAFKGLSDRLLPGAKPALDLPVTFTRAPTAVMLGFVSSTVVFILFMIGFATSGIFVLIPPMIMLFFGGGAGGVFGNAVAGWRGAVFGGVLNAVVLAVGQWIGWGLYSGTAPEIATLADADWYAVGWLVLGAGHLLAPLGEWTLWVIALAVLAVTVIVLVALGRRMPRELPADAAPDAAPAVPAPEGAALAAAPSGLGTAPSAVATERATSERPETLSVLAVCGAGMGTSLMLKMTAQKAFGNLGIPIEIEHADVSSARGRTPDLVVAQSSYLNELGTLAPVMVSVTEFVNVEHVQTRIEAGLREKGWL